MTEWTVSISTARSKVTRLKRKSYPWRRISQGEWINKYLGKWVQKGTSRIDTVSVVSTESWSYDWFYWHQRCLPFRSMSVRTVTSCTNSIKFTIRMYEKTFVTKFAIRKSSVKEWYNGHEINKIIPLVSICWRNSPTRATWMMKKTAISILAARPIFTTFFTS